MSKKVEIIGEELDKVVGGQITYTWDGNRGTIGLNGDNCYELVDKEGFIEYYNSVKGTMRDSQIMRHLLESGIARVK